MSAHAERWQRILDHPLDYLHPKRLQISQRLDTPQSREVLESIIVQDLGWVSSTGHITLSSAASALINAWLQLPEIARLLGVQAAWPHLARGAAFRHLSASERAFGPCAVSRRLDSFCTEGDSEDVAQRLDTIGLNRLLAFREIVPAVLIERLLLQFPMPVIERQRLLDPTAPDAALLTLAIQHVRIHSYPH